jgi:hypothetical protein
MVAVGGLAALVTGPAAAGAPNPADATTSWAGYAGSNIYQDAVAQVLQQSGPGPAGRFLAGQRANMGESTFTALDAEVAKVAAAPVGSTEVQAAVTQLLGGPGVGSAAPNALTAVTAAPAPAIITAAVAEPVQATHGDSRAVNPSTWFLHGNSGFTAIFYGSCSTIGCVTDGHFNAAEASNVVFQPEVFWRTEIREGAGQHATFSAHKVRMMQDRTGGVDATVLTLGCSTGGTNALDCTASPFTPTVRGNWYYYREDLRATYAGGAALIQIQTRRWLNNGATLDFPSAAFGG